MLADDAKRIAHVLQDGAEHAIRCLASIKMSTFTESHSPIPDLFEVGVIVKPTMLEFGCDLFHETSAAGGGATMRMELLRFNGAVERDPAIDAWLKEHAGDLGEIARQWFEVMRKCGDEVRELLHDGCPVACLGDAPFGYVNVFTSHVNVGFFHGAALPDPGRLLQGTGKFMRHVKLRPGTATNAAALRGLIDAAYSDIKARVENG
jgi:hypothetical protein